MTITLEMLEKRKAHIIKQKDEICLNEIVAKAEKTCEMITRLNPK